MASAQSSPFPVIFKCYMPPWKIFFLIQAVQKNFISIFQVFTPLVCSFASSTTNSVCPHISFQKTTAAYFQLIDSASNNQGAHFIYAGANLIWHCENTPISAFSELREEILGFPLHHPDSCFARCGTGMSLFFYVPTFLGFLKTLVCPLFIAFLI